MTAGRSYGPHGWRPAPGATVATCPTLRLAILSDPRSSLEELAAVLAVLRS